MRGPALVAELPEGARGTGALEEVVYSEALEETDYQPLQEKRQHEGHQEHCHGADEPRDELGERAQQVVGGFSHQIPPP